MENLNYPKEAIGLENIALRGNIIDREWRKHILKPCKKTSTQPDELAINILSEIVFVYTPYVIKGSDGATLKVIKRFKGVYWNQSMKQLSENFLRSEDAVRKALQNLERLKLIKRVFTNEVRTSDNRVLRNIQSIVPITANIAKISTQIKTQYSEVEIENLGHEVMVANDDHEQGFMVANHDHQMVVNHDHIVTNKGTAKAKKNSSEFFLHPASLRSNFSEKFEVSLATKEDLKKLMERFYFDNPSHKDLIVAQLPNISFDKLLLSWANHFLVSKKKTKYNFIELHNNLDLSLSWLKDKLTKNSMTLHNVIEKSTIMDKLKSKKIA